MHSTSSPSFAFFVVRDTKGNREKKMVAQNPSGKGGGGGAGEGGGGTRKRRLPTKSESLIFSG